MSTSTLTALTPLDGRYKTKVEPLSSYFSEYSLIRYRLKAEIDYLLFLSQEHVIARISPKLKETLLKIVADFDVAEAEKVKIIEKRINHDVKAIEYYLREKLAENKDKHAILQYFHICLTSEDINSIAYSLALQESQKELVLPTLKALIEQIVKKAQEEKTSLMLARTHGQPAVPTTMGKELSVFAMRLYEEYKNLSNLEISAKLNGAVGNFNAHQATFPKFNWIQLSNKFITSLGLKPELITTQILPFDSYINIFHSLHHINAILIGFSQDMWRYISDDYFLQEVNKDTVGSSTMPQKVNPIDFENCEGNLGVANALFAHFADKLAISRLQRDLSDSTVKRNFGSAFGYSMLGWKSFSDGFGKVHTNHTKLTDDINQHWEIVTEGIQCILRANGDDQGYEKLKTFSRGKKLTKSSISKFINTSSFSKVVKNKLLQLSPTTYAGLSEQLVDECIKSIKF